MVNQRSKFKVCTWSDHPKLEHYAKMKEGLSKMTHARMRSRQSSSGKGRDFVVCSRLVFLVVQLRSEDYNALAGAALHVGTSANSMDFPNEVGVVSWNTTPPLLQHFRGHLQMIFVRLAS